MFISRHGVTSRSYGSYSLVFNYKINLKIICPFYSNTETDPGRNVRKPEMLEFCILREEAKGVYFVTAVSMQH
jgi:hypothetical protein